MIPIHTNANNKKHRVSNAYKITCPFTLHELLDIRHITCKMPLIHWTCTRIARSFLCQPKALLLVHYITIHTLIYTSIMFIATFPFNAILTLLLGWGYYWHLLLDNLFTTAQSESNSGDGAASPELFFRQLLVLLLTLQLEPCRTNWNQEFDLNLVVLHGYLLSKWI